MVIGDHLLKEVDHMSTVFAPIMIAVTFFQTLGLLLDLDVTWPPALRRWMSFFNLLNVNLQIARPECSGTFGVKERLEITLALPVSVAVLLGGDARGPHLRLCGELRGRGAHVGVRPLCVHPSRD